MSRDVIKINENISIATGTDHAIGRFIDVMDKRYANSGKDYQGEGYVMEYSTMFKFGTNLIGLTEEDIPLSNERIIEACDEFAKRNQF